ncbi:thioredoxin family protein [Christiangramia forsetii]|uniref:Thioredoxin-like protein n=2 Tax=Christiangramia forsetii TaxID=411153 RepID=A0M183_CHRFK|nr:thioredoxin family protein [Christiangramia forsetii]GGG43133.1 thioredoxin [Christiangramia forsetii]CAL66378.1 thioredoxin-like protein [Christiangramia forsetii KT0803]
MKEIIENSLKNAMEYSQYQLLFKQLVEKGRTTGEETDEKINYTKLNFSRSKRLDKTIKLSEKEKQCFKNIRENQTWLVITEPWCGDAAQSLPFFNKIAQISEKIALKIVLRDENPNLMDAFLTKGSRSIPKLIILNKEKEILNVWGPRSSAATKLVQDYLEEHGKIDDIVKTNLQLWYNQDKGKAILTELQELALYEKRTASI